MADKILRLMPADLDSGSEEARLTALREIFGDSQQTITVTAGNKVPLEEVLELIDEQGPAVVCFEQISSTAFELLKILFWTPILNILVIGAIHRAGLFCGYIRLDGELDPRFLPFDVADLLEDEKSSRRD